MSKINEEVLDAAMAAYGLNKRVRPDRERLRKALEAVYADAFSEGYKKGHDAAEYNDGQRT